MNGICNCRQGRDECTCGRELDIGHSFTAVDHIINILCACVLAWVLWQAIGA